MESAARLHLDLACVTLHRTQEEFEESTRKLEEKVDALEKKLEERVDERVNTLQKKVEAKIDGVQASLTTRIEINDYLYDLRLEREATRVFDNKRESPSFIWRINGMNRILREAKRSTDVESEPFLSGANGYKLKVLMQPSGDLSRSGKNGYVTAGCCTLAAELAIRQAFPILPFRLNHNIFKPPTNADHSSPWCFSGNQSSVGT